MDPLLRIAFRTARDVGRHLLSTFDRPPYSRMGKTALRSFTHDLRSDLLQMFVEQIHRAYPSHSVFSDATQQPKPNSIHWFIDVIDGQTNFRRSLTDYCAVIGIFDDGILLHSMVYHYGDDLEFYATKDIGAQVNQSRLRVSSPNTINDSVIAISDVQILQQQSQDPSYSKLLTKLHVHRVETRTSGSLALDIMRVAQGKHDGCITTNTKSVKQEIGALLVREAGGSASDAYSSSSYFIVANPLVFSILCKWTAAEDLGTT